LESSSRYSAGVLLHYNEVVKSKMLRLIGMTMFCFVPGPSSY